MKYLIYTKDPTFSKGQRIEKPKNKQILSANRVVIGSNQVWE